MNTRLRELLGDVGESAVGHFFCGWDDESCQAIVSPYKHGYCNTQHGSSYHEFSKYLFDLEVEVCDLLSKEEYSEDEITLAKEIGEHCQILLDSIDNPELLETLC